jgi:D-alanyl-D-alanine carboxypeptidase/D-alanyl-D-alanine-endopeptidase (penicillin-binding protein 4)
MVDTIIRPRADMDRRTMRSPAIAVLLAAASFSAVLFVGARSAATPPAAKAPPAAVQRTETAPPARGPAAQVTAGRAATAPAAAPARPAPAAPRAAVPDAVRAQLSTAIRDAVAKSGLPGESVAVTVTDIATGAAIHDDDGARPMVPASNMKVISTGAALALLGPDFRFSTRLLRDGDRLTVVGDGDPSFGDEAMLPFVPGKPANATALVDAWVAAAKQAGVSRVRELVVDARIFDAELTSPDWHDRHLDNTYCARVAGLSFHENLVGAVLGTRGGKPELLRWDPPAPWMTAAADGSASANPKKASTLGIARTGDPDRFVLRGNLPKAGPDPIPICVPDPAAFFGRFLAARLSAAGVPVGTVRMASATDPAPAGGVVGTPVTTPLTEVVRRCNEESQNLYAESLVKRMGAAATKAPGSWANGMQAVRGVLASRLGPELAAAFDGKDGSGLADANRVTTQLMCAWIRSMVNDPALARPFIESLAKAGQEGTVKDRFKPEQLGGSEVACKTGYINGVICLSGCVGPAGGTPRFAFSVLCNGLAKEKNGIRRAKDLQNAIVERLAKAP